MRKRAGLAALVLLLALPSVTTADPELTGLVNSTYLPRTESLHDLAHQRAQYQIAYSGGVCAENSLTHDGWTTAEVLACNYSGPARAVEQWLGSAPHHAILSDPAYTEIGCATAYGAAGAMFFACVLMWGTEKPPPGDGGSTAEAESPPPSEVARIAPIVAPPTPQPVLPDTATR